MKILNGAFKQYVNDNKEVINKLWNQTKKENKKEVDKKIKKEALEYYKFLSFEDGKLIYTHSPKSIYFIDINKLAARVGNEIDEEFLNTEEKMYKMSKIVDTLCSNNFYIDLSFFSSPQEMLEFDFNIDAINKLKELYDQYGLYDHRQRVDQDKDIYRPGLLNVISICKAIGYFSKDTYCNNIARNTLEELAKRNILNTKIRDEENKELIKDIIEGGFNKTFCCIFNSDSKEKLFRLLQENSSNLNSVYSYCKKYGNSVDFSVDNMIQEVKSKNRKVTR